MIPAIGYAARNSSGRLKPFSFERAMPRPNDVTIDVMFCGVCHSDIHQAKDEWANTVYPCVPGHEVVGRVSAIGAAVTLHAVGDIVGVGCMIDSCRACEPCQSGEQNYCEGPNSWLATYNGPMIPAATAGTNVYGVDNSFGGYSNIVVVPEDFVLRIPEGLDPAAAAPILCAGATTWSPMKHWGVEPGDSVGIIGLGGLGNMAAKLAVALGAEVTVFTSSRDKLDCAAELGVEMVLEKDAEALAALARSFDFILSTVPEKHDLNPFVPLLKRDATLVVVGALEPMKGIDNQAVAFSRRSIAGSLIGNLADTQDVLDFCAERGVAPDIEIIAIADINDAFKRIEKGDVRFRCVIDMATLTPDP